MMIKSPLLVAVCPDLSPLAHYQPQQQDTHNYECDEVDGIHGWWLDFIGMPISTI